MREVKDLTGRRFGRLTVISRAENSPSGKIRWLCKCDCGNEKVIGSSALVQGYTRSCGCLRSEYAKLSNEERKELKVGKPDKVDTFGSLYSKESADYCLHCPLPECINCLERGGLEAARRRADNKIKKSRFIESYLLGLSDNEIAVRLHRSVFNIYHQRYRYGLPIIPKGSIEQRKEFARECVDRMRESRM